MGSTIQNIHRQFSEPRMNPDRVGPTAGATAMTIEMVPIVWPRRSAGISFITVVISSGTMTAVPQACTIRPPSSTAKPGASAEIRVPAQNADIDARKTARTEKRCSSDPDIGITTAMVSRKPLVSHCAVRAVMSRSEISTGSATLMIVSLRIMTKAEKTSSAMMTPADGGAVGVLPCNGSSVARVIGPVLMHTP